MKRKIESWILFTMCCFIMAWLFPSKLVYASDGEYITISVDATDDNGNLKYALDTDDPAAFTDSNEFTILAGTSHTIYVKDTAGNITSQTYTPSSDVSYVADVSQDLQENEQRINIDLEIKRQSNKDAPDYSDYEYLTDEPVEPGTGTVAEKIKTDASEDSNRIFYTITTKEGEVLYLIIDQGQSADNVYLLDTVSADDLLALSDGASGKSAESEKEDNLFAALSKEADTEENEEKSNSSNGNLLIVVFVVIFGGGVYYYFKVYKNKKDEAMDVMDAMDMEDFEAEEGEEEEADFSYDDEEKEKYLEELISDDDTDLYDVSPEEYVDSENNSEETDFEEYGLDEEEQEESDL